MNQFQPTDTLGYGRDDLHESNLFDAIYQKQWSTAKTILLSKSSRHTQARYLGSGHSYPLHLACSYEDVPLDIIQLLLDAFKDAAMMQTPSGHSPLHEAISDFAPDDVVLFLLDTCPQAASLENHWGQSPLHAAIFRDRSNAIIQRLLLADPSKITSRDRKEKTPLHYFFRNWRDAVLDALHLLDTGAVSLEGVLDTDVRDTRAKKRKLKEVHDKACLLFQDASEKDRSWSVLHSILSTESCPWYFIRFFAKLHPEEVLVKNKLGDLPIHVAASGPDADFFMLAKQGYYEYIDKWKLARGKMFTAVSDLLEIYPTSASIPNHRGKLPIHIAIENATFYDADAIMKLFLAAPESIHTRDIETHLLPFMAAAVGNVSCCACSKDSYLQQFTLVFDLLMDDPHSVLWGSFS